jgi:hypothetical protein
VPFFPVIPLSPVGASHDALRSCIRKHYRTSSHSLSRDGSGRCH